MYVICLEITKGVCKMFYVLTASLQRDFSLQRERLPVFPSHFIN